MNILFISLLRFNSFEERNIYTDLLREFIKRGYHVDAISPTEQKYHEKTRIIRNSDGNRILSLRIGNIQKCNIIEKGLTVLSLEKIVIKAIREQLSDYQYDLVLYTTPPITFAKAIGYVKKRDNAKAYLLLKDIFPQNAVDIGMLKKKGIMYHYFRAKEKQLYQNSDIIGCMSVRNAEYVHINNPEISKEKIKLCPNCIEPQDVKPFDKAFLRDKLGVPQETIIFMYGGNLGKPQDVDFIVSLLELNKDREDRFFIICGTGTESHKINKFLTEKHPSNMKYIGGLPKDEYDNILKVCDIGMVFLDHRFTIPNFPSRMLSYMEFSLPIVAFTDCSTDVSEMILCHDIGWWAESKDETVCMSLINQICEIPEEIFSRGKRANEYLKKNYTCEVVCNQIEEDIL